MRRVGWVLALLVGGPLLWVLAVWPPPVWYRSHWPRQTAFMAQRGGPAAYRPVPLDSIVPAMAQAAIIGEDGNFYSHHGIDYLALAQALGYQRRTFSWSDSRDRKALLALLPQAWARRDRLRGASTITQQLAKNLYLSPSRNPLRKVKEAVIAWRLEAVMDKQRILELYLNSVELGNGIWGVEAASEAYFSRHARDLTTEQAAALAGALPFPRRSNPGHRPGRMEWRQALILRRMRGEEVEVPKVAEEDEAPDTTAALDSALASDTLPLLPDTTLPRVLPPGAPDSSLTPDSSPAPYSSPSPDSADRETPVPPADSSR
jgi:monofunctional glycosyltransferase